MVCHHPCCFKKKFLVTDLELQSLLAKSPFACTLVKRKRKAIVIAFIGGEENKSSLSLMHSSAHGNSF
jgi:hypothetical protein